MSQELTLFIKEGLTRGLSREELKVALQTAKWQDEEIEAAFARYAISDFPIPVPAPKASLSAREAFTYLVLFVTLYLTAFSVGTLWFSFVNQWFPDQLFYNNDPYNTGGIREACATLLITAPLFFGLSWRLRRRLAHHPDERQSGVRKWLTYLTLFVAASVIIGTLIGLVYNVLSGELTWRFTIKALTVLMITGLGFGYYLWDLRQDETALTKETRTRMRLFAGFILLLTLGTLVGGLILSGSPTQERLRRLDEQREQALDQLTYAIDNHYANVGFLPTSQDQLFASSHSSLLEAPGLMTRLPDFSYALTATTSYRLCTSFNLLNDPTALPGQDPSITPVKPSSANVRLHSAGINCFPLDVRRQPR